MERQAGGYASGANSTGWTLILDRFGAEIGTGARARHLPERTAR